MWPMLDCMAGQAVAVVWAVVFMTGTQVAGILHKAANTFAHVATQDTSSALRATGVVAMLLMAGMLVLSIMYVMQCAANAVGVGFTCACQLVQSAIDSITGDLPRAFLSEPIQRLGAWLPWSKK